MTVKPKRFLVLLFLITLLAGNLFADADRFKFRILTGMEPLGSLTGVGMDSGGGDLVMSSSYGFSPGFEALIILGDSIEAGIGFQWQLPRKVIRSGGGSDELFGFVPVYGTARVILTELDPAELYFAAKLGYTFLTDSTGFYDILPAGSGGPLVSTSGGLFASAALGVSYVIKDRPKWGMDLSMDLGYAFYGGTGKSLTSSFPINYQTMSVNFALDWRF